MGDVIRIGGRATALLLALAACLVGYGLALPGGNTVPWVRRFLRLAAAVLGADVTVVGRPRERGVLFVANHVSWFDILAIGGATGSAFVSKDGVANWPVVGALARMGGTIFITRTSRAAARSQADALTAALATGRPATLFPEGTTNDGRTVLPFRAALFAAAPAAGARVQPIAMDYGTLAPAVAWGPDESAMAVARRLVGRRGRIPITLRFLDPVPDSDDRKTLAAAAQAAIVAALAGTTQPQPHPL